MELRSLTAADASACWKIRLEALECDPEAFTESADEHRSVTVEPVAARLSSDPENNFIMGASSSSTHTRGHLINDFGKGCLTAVAKNYLCGPALKGRGLKPRR